MSYWLWKTKKFTIAISYVIITAQKLSIKIWRNIMKLNFITFMVRDINKSVAFYQELAGLQIINRISPGAGEIVFLANEKGETMLELIEFANVEKVVAKGMVLSFSAEDELEGLRDKAITLGYFPSEIIEQGPKPKHFTVADPDGIIVEFSL